MNKKYIGFFIIFLVAILAFGSVNAVKLENHNFDDYFSMELPKNVHFEKEKNISNEEGIDNIYISYLSEELGILYFDNPTFSENSSQFMYQKMFESSFPDLDECYESQEGNLTILEPKNIDETHIPVVATTSGNEMVFIMGKDLDMIKQMGESVDFN